MKYVIEEEVLQNILNYLGNQPYKDVFNTILDIQTKSIKYLDYIKSNPVNDFDKSKVTNNTSKSKSKKVKFE